MSLVDEIVGSLVDGALREILKKPHRTRRTRRKSRNTNVLARELEKILRPPTKQTSRKRTTKNRSKTTRRKIAARKATRRTATRRGQRR